MPLSRWPQEFFDRKKGIDCPHCLDGRADRTEHGVRYFAPKWPSFAAVEAVFAPVHLNVQVLGNAVPHVHAHIVGRYDPDPAPSMPLPAETWARAATHTEEQLHSQLDALRNAIGKAWPSRSRGPTDQSIQ